MSRYLRQLAPAVRLYSFSLSCCTVCYIYSDSCNYDQIVETIKFTKRHDDRLPFLSLMRKLHRFHQNNVGDLTIAFLLLRASAKNLEIKNSNDSTKIRETRDSNNLRSGISNRKFEESEMLL